jgi:2-polyprenyl-3-methyl-5-hydroxy-6-metoxy-1,4-benzoquinol methylase
VLALREGQKLVDVGCGPAGILDLLPAVKYVGIDISEPYIQPARQQYGDRGVFLAGRLKDWSQDARIQGADVVLTNGVLHHVDDDEATEILRAGYAILNENGRLSSTNRLI